MQYVYYKNVTPFDDNNINIFINNFIQKYLISKGTKLIKVTFTEEEIAICKEFIDDYLRDYLQQDAAISVQLILKKFLELPLLAIPTNVNKSRVNFSFIF